MGLRIEHDNFYIVGGSDLYYASLTTYTALNAAEAIARGEPVFMLLEPICYRQVLGDCVCNSSPTRQVQYIYYNCTSDTFITGSPVTEKKTLDIVLVGKEVGEAAFALGGRTCITGSLDDGDR